MKIVIIKYNAGNIESVNNALLRLGITAEISSDPEIINSADKVIFPGVGEASTTMAFLKYHKLDILIKQLSQPVLGICLGLQLMCSKSEEGNVDCLGIFPEKVKKFIPRTGEEYITKVPHMGWNSINNLKCNLFTPEMENQFVYFVHSYFAEIGDNTTAICNYINPFSASLQKNNFFATQFHPEKSQKVGENIIKNFIAL